MKHVTALYHRLADAASDLTFALEVHQNVVLLLLGQALLVIGLALVWVPLAFLVPGVELSVLGLLREYEPKRKRRPREVTR